MSQLFADLVQEHRGTRSEQGLRSAALMLHAMDATDRAWLLSRVTPEQRQALQPLLMELEALGVPAHWQETRDLLSQRHVQPRSADDPVMGRIAVAKAAVVFSVLAAEPAGLVDRVMALADWPWRAEVLAMLRSKRGAVFKAMEAGAKPDPRLSDADRSELDHATLHHLAAQLSHEPTAVAARLTPGARERLRAFWRNPLRRSQG